MKQLKFVLMVALCCLFVTGCRYSYEISETAYVAAAGIDVGEIAPYRFTFQFAKPLKIAGSGEEESGGGSESESGSTSVFSTEANDMFTALNILNNALSKQVNLSHMKLLLFSTDIAQKGITDPVRFLMKNNQARPSTFVAVAQGSAVEYLKEVKPALEVNPSKYYTLIFSKKNSNFVPDTTLRDLYFHIKADGQEAVLPLVGVSGSSDDGLEQDKIDAALGNYTAGKSGGNSDTDTEVSGMAVLREGAMVGILPSKSVELFNICAGKLKPSYYHVPSELTEGDSLVLNLQQAKKPHYKVEIKNNVPSIQVRIDLTAQMVKAPPEEYAAKNISQLNEMTEQYIKAEVESFLRQTTDEVKSDIVGFGRHAKVHFSDFQAWTDFDWRSRYPTASISADVHVRITNDGLIEKK